MSLTCRPKKFFNIWEGLKVFEIDEKLYSILSPHDSWWEGNNDEGEEKNLRARKALYDFYQELKKYRPSDILSPLKGVGFPFRDSRFTDAQTDLSGLLERPLFTAFRRGFSPHEQVDRRACQCAHYSRPVRQS